MSNDIHSDQASGALSSGGYLPTWQIPFTLEESAARRMKKGNDKGYDIHNWRKGLSSPAFIRDRAYHAWKHFKKLTNGIEDAEDGFQENIDAVTWFMAFINEAMRLHPEAVRAAFYSDPRGEKITEGK